MDDIIINNVYGLALAWHRIPEAKAKPVSRGFDWVIKIAFGGIYRAGQCTHMQLRLYNVRLAYVC